ncbi:pyridine nucleotide-disulfide oxidoreductase [Putridiphycobacter roseus]|uniref:Pyridine nucleotide-disulfide oxidoreductase n=1 Tax=Putridiphycobacter roseus TaxID=2219161 RepID=A0A2W1NA48_9FLAO|nr:ArsO family NAD(P)H-dependent flavin-containing monooxygenase [Putridiphycobacter roseus]PZE15903.1 pyridine nucleotide-disulfide oxidoreductase [Putridiphycobacter roseus]
MKTYDTLVIGGGQAGLATAYFLRRYKLDYLVLDDQAQTGGSWLGTWDSLKLFSPAAFSSLPGWAMPQGAAEYPGKAAFISYLNEYEKRYNFPVQHHTKVLSVIQENEGFAVATNKGTFYSKTLVSATGTAQHPFIPKYPGQAIFEGEQLHSSGYKNADNYAHKKVLIVGGGNSGAQILAEVSKVAHTEWVTRKAPRFLPDDIDGRYLFNEATSKFLENKADHPDIKKPSLSEIVMIDSVKEARARGVLHAKRPFKAFYDKGVIWEDGTKSACDIVIWCTGFKANLNHLKDLNIINNNRIETEYTRAKHIPNLWLVGYGSWTGFASATIYGVGKTARQTVHEIVDYLA